MPGCVQRASEDGFQPHSFLEDSGLVPCIVFRKGEAKAKDRVWDSSGFTVVVSEASGDEFAQQIRDSVVFLRKQKEELARLMRCTGLEDARVGFWRQAETWLSAK